MEQVALLFKISEASLLFGVVRLFVFSTFFAAYAWAHCNRGIIRAGIALAFAMPVMVHVTASDAPMPTLDAPGAMILIVLKEAAIGFALAVLFSLPFWAIGAAGAALSMLRIESADDAPQIGTTPLERLLLLITIGAFAFSDVPERMMTVLYLSYDAWPISSLVPLASEFSWNDMAKAIEDVILFSITIILPFLTAILFIEALLAFSSRITRHVNLQAAMLLRSFGVIIGLILTAIIWFVTFSDFLTDFYSEIGARFMLMTP